MMTISLAALKLKMTFYFLHLRSSYITQAMKAAPRYNSTHVEQNIDLKKVSDPRNTG